MIDEYKLRVEKQRLIEYMHVKIESNDFHAVADAAMDIREIDAKLEVLKEVKP